MQATGRIALLEVLEVNRLDVVSKNLGKILRTAVETAVRGIEIYADALRGELIKEQLPFHRRNEETVPYVLEGEIHAERFGHRRQLLDGRRRIVPCVEIGDLRMRCVPRDTRSSRNDKNRLHTKPGGQLKIFLHESDSLGAFRRIVGAEPLAPARTGRKRAQPHALGLRISRKLLCIGFCRICGEAVAHRQFNSVQTLFSGPVNKFAGRLLSAESAVNPSVKCYVSHSD